MHVYMYTIPTYMCVYLFIYKVDFFDELNWFEISNNIPTNRTVCLIYLQKDNVQRIRTVINICNKCVRTCISFWIFCFLQISNINKHTAHSIVARIIINVLSFQEIFYYLPFLFLVIKFASLLVNFIQPFQLP